MKIKHHPCSASLMSCSSGSMPEAFAAVMASHITVCPSCRAELSLMEDIGVALFEKIAPEGLARPSPVGAMFADEAGEAASATSAVVLTDTTTTASAGDVPEPLVAYIGRSLDAAPWKRVAPGISQIQIPLRDHSRGSLRLVKVAPGQKLPEHGHSGQEMTYILHGAFTDRSGTYGVGDVADLGADDEHQPVADEKDGCICLIAVDGRLRFKSPVARIMQPFTGF